MPQLEKAKLKKIVTDVFADPLAQDIEFMFNPQEISVTRNSIWEFAPGTRGYSGIPKVNFSTLQPFTVSFNKLIFDTYETRGTTVNGATLEDIIKNMTRGVGILDVLGKRPPIYTLQWGVTEYFHCVMTKLTYTYTMFLNNGTPVRALVDIDLQEVEALYMLPGFTVFNVGILNPLAKKF